MTVYTICLKHLSEDNKSTTYVDCFGIEYQAAVYTADLNYNLVKDGREDVIAVCMKDEVNKIFVDKLHIYNDADNYEYSIYAEVEYDYIKDKIIKRDRGIKYVNTRPSQYIIDGLNFTMTCFIPYHSDMEDNLLPSARKLYEYHQNKIKSNKSSKRKRSIYKGC